jgi:hypothetical protein
MTHMRMFFLFQSSCVANKTTAAQNNANCCWAKQRRAEVRGERRHKLWKKEATDGCCQNPAFNEDPKASVCMHALSSRRLAYKQFDQCHLNSAEAVGLNLDTRRFCVWEHFQLSRWIY